MANFRARFLVAFCFLMNMALAQTTATNPGGPIKGSLPGITTPDVQLEINNGAVTRRQSAIWIAIMLAIIAISAVYALYGIDDVKSRDTILYAKFLANLKDR